MASRRKEWVKCSWILKKRLQNSVHCICNIFLKDKDSFMAEKVLSNKKDIYLV